MRSELARVLNPAQMEEFLLRYSQTAIDLRNEFKHFQATPYEFRAMFRARDKIDEEMGGITGDPANGGGRRQAAFQKQEDDAIKERAGATALPGVSASWNGPGLCQAAVALGQQKGATPDMVQKLYAP